MEENENEQEELNTSEEQTQQDSAIGTKAVEKLGEKLTKDATKTATKTFAKSSLAAPLLHILVWVLVAIVIIIIVVGLIMFILTMPGMVMGKIKEVSKKIGNVLSQAWLGQDQATQIDDVQIYEVLDDLITMGYDLKGYGFLTGDVTKSELTDSDVKNALGESADVEQEKANARDDNGLVISSNGNVLKAESDFIWTYLYSDNYANLVKNFNLSLTSRGDGWWGVIKGFIETTTMKVLGEALDSLPFIKFNVNEYLGRGFIVIYNEGDQIGSIGNFYHQDVWDLSKIQVKDGKLNIKKGLFGREFSYNLDGWTGRYSMPLEFLVSVHLATLMPDLAYDMATSFKTELALVLHETESSELISAYRDGGKYIYYQDHEGSQGMKDIKGEWNGTDAWILSNKEAMAILRMGINSFTESDWKDGSGKELVSGASEYVCTGPKGKNTRYNYDTINSGEYNIDTGESSTSSGLANSEEENNLTNFKEQITKYGWDGTTFPNSINTEISWSSEIIEEEKGTAQPEDGEMVTYYLTWTTDNASNGKYKIEFSRTKTSAELGEVSVSCSESDPNLYDECCDGCKKYVVEIMKQLKESNYDGKKSYTPYIAKVTNHWYRDVYFASPKIAGDNNVNLIQTDQDYERITNERWTKYHTYGDGCAEHDTNDSSKLGTYVLYELDDQGEYKGIFEGTQNDANEKGIAVAKKAVIDNVDDDWIAYEKGDDQNSNWEPIYDIELGEDDIPNMTEYIQENCYYNFTTIGDIIQVEDGKRAETNPTIKKMFLSNTYFRYDGSTETADIISELRGKLSEKSKYGALSEDDLNAIGNTVKDENGVEQNVSDYIGQVSLNKDSLNAFSMLENTHTLDADFIYKDFKELVVELGYFTKEELADNPPRLLEFPIPDIASGGFPIRSLDKKETEYGTFLHSEDDYTRNEANTLAAIAEKVKEEMGGEIPETPEDPPDATGTLEDNTQNVLSSEAISERNKILRKNETSIIGQVASVTNTPIANLRSVGAITDVSAANYTFTPVSSPAQGSKVGDLTFNGVDYECWWQTSVTCTLYSFAFVASSYTGEPFETYIQETAPYWSSGGLSGSCWETAGVSGTYYRDTSGNLPSDDESMQIISEALSQGKPVWFYSGLGSSGGRHAIVLLGASSSGTILYYDPWPKGGVQSIKEYGNSSTFSANLQQLFSSGVYSDGGRFYGCFIPDEVPTGVNMSSSVSSFSGFKGGEAVVSPVTGILLDYGTYTEEDEDYRINVDASTLAESEENAENAEITTDTVEVKEETESGEENIETPEYTKKVVDKVGYAKILVLDEEHINKLLGVYDDEGNLQTGGLITANPNDIITKEVLDKADRKNVGDSEEININSLTDEALQECTTAEAAMAGYRLFYEDYHNYGIDGYVLYIDGFKCELPENTETEEEDTGTTTTDDTSTSNEEEPKTIDGFDLSMDVLKELAAKGNDSNFTAIEENTEGVETKYEKEPSYHLESRKIQLKQNIQTELKDLATALYYDANTDELYIKEGTVIGRTLTDQELVESRGENYEDYAVDHATEEETENEVHTDEVTTGTDAESEENADIEKATLVGNYLRIIMRNPDDEIIENVEDYMKLDEDDGKKQSTDMDAEFFYWLPYESGPLEGDDSGPAATVTFPGHDEIACGIAQWTTYPGKCNNIPELCKWLTEQSDICDALKAFTSYSDTQMIANQQDFFTAWKSVAMEHREEFLALQYQYFYETQFKSWVEADGVDWILNKSMVTQGTYASLKNWATGADWWKNALSGKESASDEEIVKALLQEACNHSSSVGSLNSRWESQFVLARDILNGSFTDVEQWINTKQPSEYGEGQNVGALAKIILNFIENKNNQYAYHTEIFRRIYGKYE